MYKHAALTWGFEGLSVLISTETDAGGGAGGALPVPLLWLDDDEGCAARAPPPPRGCGGGIGGRGTETDVSLPPIAMWMSARVTCQASEGQGEVGWGGGGVSTPLMGGARGMPGTPSLRVMRCPARKRLAEHC